MSDRRHIAEYLTDVLAMHRQVSDKARAKELNLVALAANDEVNRAVEALQACHNALIRLDSIADTTKPEKPR